jgi:hypothetical protein
MIDHQKTVLLSQSTLLGKSSGFSYIQKTLDLVNIVSDFIQSHMFYGMIVNDAVKTSLIYENYEKTLGNKQDGLSTWYYLSKNETSDLPEEISDSLNYSAIYDTLIRPATKFFLKINSTIYMSAYLTYENNLIYSNPANRTKLLPNCISSDTKSSCCLNDSDINPPYYNPTCRPFFLKVIEENDYGAILTSPYNFSDHERGRSACKGLWNFSTNSIVLTYCIDFLIPNHYESFLVNTGKLSNCYSFSLDKSQTVITYKNYNQAEIGDKTISQLEFDHDRSSSSVKSEMKKFNKTIVSLMTNQVAKFTYYKRYGDKIMIAIAPVLMMLSSGDTPAQVASVAVVMKKRHVEKDFQKLIDSCNESLLFQVILQSILSFLIIVFSVIMTDTLTAHVLGPIDQLLKLMKRLKDGDLAIDIHAAYQPSPPEITVLYDVFDKLRVVLRFQQIDKEKITEASFVYSQALMLFKNFQNEQAMEICYRELGYICYKKKMWVESGMFLHQALTLAVKLGCYNDYEIARIKTDTATAYVKTCEKREEGLKIFKEAVKIFTRGNHYTDIVVAMIEITESLAETHQLKQKHLDFIEKHLENSDPLERELLRQKFFYVKAYFYKNCQKYKSAALMIRSILEDFSEFLPDISMKAVNLLNQVLLESQVPLNMFLKNKKMNYKKDVVIVCADHLASTIIGWSLSVFLKSILEPFDKASLIQYSDRVQIVFNLTKIPGKEIEIQRILNQSEKNLAFSALREGLKQFRFNRFSEANDRNEWVILLCEAEDNGSVLTKKEIIREISQSQARVIIINCFFQSGLFGNKDLRRKRIHQFFIQSGESCKIVFKEIEAFLCPYREVFL